MVQNSLPDFYLVRKKEFNEEPGLLKFSWEPRKNLNCGIVFRPLDESFDVWVGWSTDGRYPYVYADPLIEKNALYEFDRSGIMVPSIKIAGRSGSAWWNLYSLDHLANDPVAYANEFTKYYCRTLTYSEALDIVSPAVNLAFAEILDSCIPYFHKRIEYDQPAKN